MLQTRRWTRLLLLSPTVAALVVAAGSVHADVSGRVSFESVPSTLGGLDYGQIATRPLRGARVVLVDSANSIVAEGATDGEGQFNLRYSGGGEVRVVAIAESPDPPIRVQDNTDGNLTWGVTSSPVSASSTIHLIIPSGWSGSGYGEDRLSGPFAILDAAWIAARTFLAERSVSFPLLVINWSPDNRPEDGDNAAGQIGTSHWNGSELFILGKADVDTDEFDTHVIVHEWGHYFQSHLSRSDSIGGSHGSGDVLDARVAFGEGWGNAVSAMVLFPDTVYSDSFGDQQARGFGSDLEDNSDPVPGWFSEDAVQAILFDIFDSNSDSGDGVSLGIGPIYDVMSGPLRNTSAMVTIFSFITALHGTSPGSGGGLDQLVTRHAMVPIRDSFGQGETNDGGFPPNLPVYHAAQIGGPPIVVALRGDEPTNAAGQNRFVAFDGNGSPVRVTATTDRDVLLAAFQNGRVLDSADGFFAGTETVSFGTTAGSLYVVNVRGFETEGEYECTVEIVAQ